MTNKLKAQITDSLGRIVTTPVRAGHAIHRTHELAKEGYTVQEIAAELSKGSANGFTYTAAHVQGFISLHKDCMTRVPLSKKRTCELAKKKSSQDWLLAWAAKVFSEVNT